MELSWTEKIAKYGDGIIAATATKEELGEYVTTKVYVHVREGFTDYTLWTVFQEEFHGFTVDDFRRMRSDSRAKLRTHLLKRGVYVATHNNRYTLSEVLFDLLQEEEPHKWTDEELIAALAEVKPMITTTLQDRLNPKLDALAVVLQTPFHSSQPTNTVHTPIYSQQPLTPPQNTQPTSTQDQLLTLLTQLLQTQNQQSLPAATTSVP